MLNTEELKNYLIDEADGFLLNPDNNGKTIMLSGKWGTGKTHFWQNDIKPTLDKNPINIYISLYGKELISELKFEVLKEAYNLEVKDDIISKSASMLSTIAPSLGEKSLVDGFDKLNKKAKEKKAEEILKSGSIICLDDFERKSKKIDLNDLFGYISQLALDYDCKVVIILNSNVFESEEANVFKTVKEKTVNKFFYFEPTIDELFQSIYESDEKYKRLGEYKNEILEAIQETEELNARIYIQVLDNCLEWIDKGYGSSVLRVLVLGTVNFILNDLILEYIVPLEVRGLMGIPSYKLKYKIFNEYPVQIADIISTQSSNSIEEFWKQVSSTSYEELMQRIDRKLNGKTKEGQAIITPVLQEKYFILLKENKEDIKAIWKYGYRLYDMDGIDESTYNETITFIKTGILPKQTKEVETSVPPEVIAETKV